MLGQHVREGERVVLDVVGTLRDPVQWPQPLLFDPSRFLGGQSIDPDALVPQGGGSVAGGHRCPGEDPVLGILAAAVTALTLLEAETVSDDLRVDERRTPARPADGVRLRPRFLRDVPGRTPPIEHLARVPGPPPGRRLA